MFLRLLAVFILLPLAELALLIQIGRWIGLAGTLALVVATGLLGAALARRQGARAWRAIQQEMREGRMPAGSVVDGLLILIGAIVLLTPGILTDLLGFALLLPPTRRFFRARLARRMERAVRRGETSFTVLMLR
ncbi:MAG: FxsA family protein [Gemmatimonadetes bacterium]|nr:FxsA family protein [Gemmatimonadota bacterium]